MAVWRRIKDEGAGYVFSLSDSLAILDCRYSDLLEPVSSGELYIASDYSGQHKGATHEAYSFLVTTDKAVADWDFFRREFRERWLPDGRRISFKKLNEPVRWRSLIPFLKAAATIRGNLVTVLVDSRVGNFMGGTDEERRAVFSDCFLPTTRSGTIEKVLRIASLLAMVTAGFRREDQPSLWISDHDETLETFERRESLGRLASYLTFGLTRWLKPADMLFGTTESKDVPDWAEDLTAIPDVAAGTYCSLSSELPQFQGTEHWIRVLPGATQRDRRARVVGDWLSTMSGPLRHVLLRLDVGDNGEVRSSAQAFAGALIGRPENA
jgi:hypothetical protein